MGFAQEMRDALSAFTSVSDNIRKNRDQDRADRKEARDSQNQSYTQDLGERKFGEQKREFDANKAIAWSNANETKSNNAFTQKYRTEQLGVEKQKAQDYGTYMRGMAKAAVTKANAGLPDFTPQQNTAVGNIGGTIPAAPLNPFTPPATAPDDSESDANGGLVGRNMRFAAGGDVPDPYQGPDWQAPAPQQAVPLTPAQGASLMPPQPAPQQAAAAQPAPQQAVPVTPQGNATPAPAPIDDNKGKSDNTKDFDLQKALDSWGVKTDVAGVKGVPQNPVTLGLDYLVHSDRPVVGVPTGNAPASTLATTLATKDGAPSPDDLRKLHDTIDPKNELTDSARTVATLDAVSKYYIGQGDIRKAGAAAASLIQAGKAASEKLGALAIVAAQQGHIDAATKYLTRAYDTVPDGNSLKAKMVDGGVHMTLIDPKGQEQDLGVVGPQQFFKLALGTANGSAYMDRITQLAAYGPQPAKQAEPVVDDGMKMSDRASAEHQVTKAFEASLPKDKDGAPVQPDPTDATLIQNHAFNVMSNNKNVSAGQAIDTVRRLALPSAPGVDQGLEISDAKGGKNVKFKGAPSAVFVPQEQFDALAASRAEKLKQISKAQADANQPGFMSKVGTIIGKGAEAVQRVRDANRKALGTQ